MHPGKAWLWRSTLLGSGLLSLFLFHALLTKLYRGAPLKLGVWLGLALLLLLVLREIARGVAPDSRTWLQSLVAQLDRAGFAFAILLAILLLVFDSQYARATSDGREYFAHIRSLVIDFDLSFENENTTFRTGGMPDIFPFGSAILWLPFYVAAHLWFGVLNLLGGEWSRSGYHNTYQMAVGLGTLFYGFVGLLLAYRIARDYYAEKIVVLSIFLLSLGSFLVWYLTVEASFTHGNSLFATTLFLYVWYRTKEERGPRGWLLLGLAAGLMTMVRWQNAVFLVFPVADGVRDLWRMIRSRDYAVLGGHGAFIAGFIGGFLPQMLFWKVVNGGWLALPHGQSGQQWWRDSLMTDVLFSSNHGLFAWHPIVYFAALGIPLFLVRDFRFGGLLTAVFVSQVYINGAVATWWGGSGFGGRRFASCMLLFVLGLSAIIRLLRRRPLLTVTLAMLPFVTVNAFFISAIQGRRLPTAEGITLGRILESAYDYVGNPFSFPANWSYARRYGVDPRQYDALGQQMYNNLYIDVGADGDDRFLGNGWSTPEQSQDRSWRWAVGSESILIVPLKSPIYVPPGRVQEQADYLMRIRAASLGFAGAPQQTLEVWVNGELAGRQIVRPEVRDFEVFIDSELVLRNLNEIRLRYAWSRSPADLGMSDDARQLAVRFERIELLRR